MLTLIIFLVILMTSVLVHELAHYFNARSVGVPVRAFSVGMGPVVWRRRWQGTEWRVSLLPLGGYVDLPGMAPKVDDEGRLQHPDEGMARKSLAAKLWVLMGGVLANFLLAVLLIAAVLMLDPAYRSLTSDAVLERGTRVESVVAGSPAEGLGLQAGDRIVAINGVTDPSRQQVVATVDGATRLELTVERGGERLDFATQWPLPGAGDPPRLGIQLAPVEVFDAAVPPHQALGEALSFSARAVPQAVEGFVSGFGAVLTGRPSAEVAGPVGIVTAVDQAARIGIAPVLFLAALINLSLAVFNLLPIPGLDGGRMLLATVVAVRGKPFRPGQEETIHFLGIMAVLAMIVIITFNELGALVRG